MSEIYGESSDNRFEIIGAAKKDLLKSTNINTSPDEMKVLDNFLFRCWQMGWLDKYEKNGQEKNSNEIWIELLKFIIFNSPFSRMLDKREIYRLNCKHHNNDNICNLYSVGEKKIKCECNCLRMKRYDKKHKITEK